MEPLTKEEIQAVTQTLKTAHRNLQIEELTLIDEMNLGVKLDEALSNTKAQKQIVESAAIKLNYMLGLLKH